MREDAQPIIGIEEGQATLEDMVDLDPNASRRRLEVVAVSDVPAVAVKRLEEHRVGEPDDQKPVEVGIVGDVLEQGERAGAVDRKLDWPDTGERLEAVEVSVEQNA